MCPTLMHPAGAWAARVRPSGCQGQLYSFYLRLCMRNPMPIRRRTFTRLVLVAVICLSALLTGYSPASPNPSPNLVFLDVATQQLAFWFLDGTTVTGGTVALLNGTVATLPPTWLPFGTGDFNN